MQRHLLVLLCFFLAVGCSRNDPVAAAATLAASPAGGRAAAATQIANAWTAGDLKLDAAIDFAFAQCEAARDQTVFVPTGKVPASADATAFAGAVLDATQTLETQLPQLDEKGVIFWMRVGGLAFIAAEEAHAAGRLQESRTLVLAGAQRWQTEGYWFQHSAHDALAAVILARSGERDEALRRLDSRAQLDGQAAEVHEMLKRGQ